MICPYCKQEVISDKQIVPMDRPYRLNINFHRDCIKILGDGLEKFVLENIDEIWAIYNGNGKKLQKKQ